MKNVFYDVRFQKCTRGYLLDAGGASGGIGSLYAFDDIEGVAAWFIEQFRDEDVVDAVIAELEAA